MQTFKSFRASDKIAYLDMEKSGFIIRKRTPIHAVVLLLKVITACVGGIALLFYYNNVQGFVLAAGLGGVIVYIGRKLERQQAIQQSTEFMNALFSSALGDGYKFCAVSRRDGKIVYVNRAFQLMFSVFVEQPSHDLKTLIALCKIADEDGQKLISLAADGTAGTVPTTMLVGTKQSEPITISITPISKPVGFIMLRGK